MHKLLDDALPRMTYPKLSPMGAIFSDCRTWRYVLWRDWDTHLAFVAFIGLNPSTADETTDDPTVRRCIGYAKAWGYGGLYMLNLFAFRATDPKAMRVAQDPIGPLNNQYLVEYSKKAGQVIAAWGCHGPYRNRDIGVLAMIPDLFCLGQTKAGHPRHPLYLRADTQPTRLR